MHSPPPQDLPLHRPGGIHSGQPFRFFPGNPRDGRAISLNSRPAFLLLGMATNMPLLPSITRISCTTNSPSIVIEAIARILPSRVTRRSRTSVISNLLHHPFPEMMYFTYSTWMVVSLQVNAKNFAEKSRIFYEGYRFDLDGHILWQSRNLDTGPRRTKLTEKLGINFVHLLKMIHILQENRSFHHLL